MFLRRGWKTRQKEMNMGKKKKLNEDSLKKVNGGMKIEPVKDPKFLGPLLKLVFKVKKEQQ